MAGESKLVGDWMASAYLPDGTRVEYELALRRDGSYVWWGRQARRSREFSHGTWYHDFGQNVLYLTPAVKSGYSKDKPQLWQILPITGLEDAAAVIVLRRVARTDDNLPVLFYRVKARGK
jgi:hypothetical protein